MTGCCQGVLVDRETHLIDGATTLNNGTETFLGEVPKRDCGGMELDIILSELLDVTVKLYGKMTSGGTRTLIETVSPSVDVHRVLLSIACGAFPYYEASVTVVGAGYTAAYIATLKNCRNMDRSSKIDDGTIVGQAQAIADIACDASTRAAL